jgi:hypothetical protein
MKTYHAPLGRVSELKHDHPERTARRAGAGVFDDVIFQVWPNRQSMARSISMQQGREHRQMDWHALVPLTPGEGY